MTPLALVPLRLAATVAHALPGVRLRLHHAGQTLVAVARPPEPPEPVIGPCAFRNAVARAHRQIEAGHRLRFLGLDEGEAPAVDVAVASPNRVQPGGLLRIAVDDAQVHAFATTLAPRTCRSVLGSDLDAADGLALHHDAATDITIVHAIRRGADAGELPSRLEDALLRCAGEELTHDLVSSGLTGNAGR